MCRLDMHHQLDIVDLEALFRVLQINMLHQLDMPHQLDMLHQLDIVGLEALFRVLQVDMPHQLDMRNQLDMLRQLDTDHQILPNHTQQTAQFFLEDGRGHFRAFDKVEGAAAGIGDSDEQVFVEVITEAHRGGADAGSRARGS